MRRGEVNIKRRIEDFFFFFFFFLLIHKQADELESSNKVMQKCTGFDLETVYGSSA